MFQRKLYLSSNSDSVGLWFWLHWCFFFVCLIFFGWKLNVVYRTVVTNFQSIYAGNGLASYARPLILGVKAIYPGAELGFCFLVFLTLSGFSLSTFSCVNLGAGLWECFTQYSYFTLTFRLSFDPALQRGSLHCGSFCYSSLLLFVTGYLQAWSLGDVGCFMLFWFRFGFRQVLPWVLEVGLFHWSCPFPSGWRISKYQGSG